MAENFLETNGTVPLAVFDTASIEEGATEVGERLGRRKDRKISIAGAPIGDNGVQGASIATGYSEFAIRYELAAP